jgi:hypothetical protein
MIVKVEFHPSPSFTFNLHNLHKTIFSLKLLYILLFYSVCEGCEG